MLELRADSPIALMKQRSMGGPFAVPTRASYGSRGNDLAAAGSCAVWGRHRDLDPLDGRGHDDRNGGRSDTSKYPFRAGRCRDSLMLSALGRLGWVSQGSSIWMSAISVCRRTATRW